MGQRNARRVQTKFRATCTNPEDNVRQDVDNTCIFEVNHIVDVIDVDANGNIISTLDNNNKIISIIPNNAVILDTSVDTSAATGTPMIRNQTLDDAQEALSFLMCRKSQPGAMSRIENIEAQELNAPIAGQTTFDIPDANLLKAGDLADIIADEGDIALGVTVVSVEANADAVNNKATVVVQGIIDTSAFTNPQIKVELTTEEAILRTRDTLDGIDQPIENRFLGIGDGVLTAFETPGLFVEGSSKLYGEGRLKRGTPGTRATHTEGAGSSQLIATSMILGTLGNEVELEVVNAAGLSVTVTKTFKVTSSGTDFSQSQYLVQVNSNSGAATSQEIADAINADADAKRIMQVQYGTDGTGVVTPFGPVNLLGGLDDGTRDYADLEQIFENNIVGTGFKWVSAHIRPDDRNRLDAPFEDDEELDIDYRKATKNVDK